MHDGAFGRMMKLVGLNGETGMNARNLCLVLVGVAALPQVWAGGGLQVPAAATLWPQWQARISLQSASVSPLALTPLYGGGVPQRSLQGATVLGDYYFAKPSFGGFRASGGLLFGSQAGAPLASVAAGSRLSLAVNGANLPPLGAGPDAPNAVTYFGLGFTGGSWRSGLSVTADVGMVAERLGAAAGDGRALFGTQGAENALREMRLSPMLQLGLRYTF